MLTPVILAIALAAAPAFAQQASQPFGAGAYRANEPGLVKPRLLKQVPPNYPSVAKNASVAGVVELEAVVKPDGTVGDVRIVRSLDKRFGLDDEAVRVAKRWLFEPARKDGFPVPVIVTIVVQFKLRADAGRGPVIGVPSGTFTASAAQGGFDESDIEFFRGAYQIQDPGVDEPKLKKPVPPRHPRPGLGPAGQVELDAIVQPDGTVGKVRVSRSMDKQIGLAGFDAAAVDAAKQWVFEPGRKDGAAAAVAVKIVIEFRNQL
jgi:TonB family protein